MVCLAITMQDNDYEYVRSPISNSLTEKSSFWFILNSSLFLSQKRSKKYIGHTTQQKENEYSIVGYIKHKA